MGVMWNINPKKRRRKSKSRKSRKLSAAQVAAGFGGKKHRRSRKGRTRSRKHNRAVAAAPRKSRRRSRKSFFGGKRRSRRSGGGFSKAGILGLVKAGAIGGAGAVAGDVMMGYASKFLQQMGMGTLTTPVNAADGSVNYSYYGTKAALLVALGTYGKRLPVIGGYAERMAEGGLTVLAYQFLRPLVSQALPLGYLNPAPTMRPALSGSRANPYIAGSQARNYIAGTGAYVNGVGAYASLPVRSNRSGGKGAAAATVLSMVGKR